MNDGFVPATGGPARPVVSGPLAGLRLSVKDVIDVAGVATGAGQPSWGLSHPVPTEDADAVRLLLAAGAEFAGKTQTDELAYSLFGSNRHYGTPPNPRAPGHLPGGSSSGAAATVAGGAADLGLGTDTAGSIRVPASWCGLLGLRPTQARVSRRGLVPLAARFDVPGLLTRDLATLAAAAGVLLAGSGSAADPLTRLLLPAGCWSDPALAAALRPALERLSALLATRTMVLPDPPVEAFAVSQGAQAWQAHGDWITEHTPEFGPGVGSRFRAAARLLPEQISQAERQLAALRDTLRSALAGGGVLALPSTPCAAPPADRPPTADTRRRLISLTMLASVAGLPAVSLPVGTLHGRPLGLSLIGAEGQDERLIAVAGELAGIDGLA